MPSARKRCWYFLKVYGRSLFSLVYPLALLPIFLISNSLATKSCYVLLLVSGYWILEVIPLAVSSMIPLVLFPFMDLMDSDTVAICYSRNAMIFIGGFMISIAVEYSNLHTRISLHLINKIGFRPRKLLVGLIIITALTSMWISPTAATAMMVKIVYAALKEMEAGGICQMWEHQPDPIHDNGDASSPTDLDELNAGAGTMVTSRDEQATRDMQVTDNSVKRVTADQQAKHQFQKIIDDAVGRVLGRVTSDQPAFHQSQIIDDTVEPVPSEQQVMHHLQIIDDTVERDIGINDDELFVFDRAPRTYDGYDVNIPSTVRSRRMTMDTSHSTMDWARRSTADRLRRSTVDRLRRSTVDRLHRSTTDRRQSGFLGSLPSVAIFDHIQRREDTRQPTKITMCFLISTSFAANIGGLPSLVGSGPNKVLKGMFYVIFPTSDGISYGKWIGTNVPLMLIMLLLTTLWMQLFYLGLFRPKSEDARAIAMDVVSETRAKNMIKRKLEELPPMSFHELMVALLSFTLGIVWVCRDVSFMPGWETLNEEVQNVTVAIAVFVLMFMIPAKPHCFRSCSNDETKRPTTISSGLLTWEVIHKQFPWGLIFLLGGGVALAAGLKKSGASHVVADKLGEALGHTPLHGMIVLCSISILFTQVMSNYTVPNIFLPIVGELAVNVTPRTVLLAVGAIFLALSATCSNFGNHNATTSEHILLCKTEEPKTQRVHPVYYMLPMTIACNLAFCLPSSTPAMAMACFASNIRTTQLLKMAIPVTIMCLLVVIVLFPLIGPPIWETNIYPDWADDIETN